MFCARSLQMVRILRDGPVLGMDLFLEELRHGHLSHDNARQMHALRAQRLIALLKANTGC